MYRVSRNKIDAWSPACSYNVLQKRAWLLSSIRSFFNEQGVLEVETPLLGQAVGTDPNLGFFSTHFLPTQGLEPGISKTQSCYLQTSPEFAMKRLLAAGSGSIFQICKAFRNEELGRFHNPEFTILEWYRLGFDLEQLMDDIELLFDRLFTKTMGLVEPDRFTYEEVFYQYTGLNVLYVSISDFERCAESNRYTEAKSICNESRSDWLDFLFSHMVQPQLGRERLTLIYDFPTCQASLARIRSDEPEVAERVEVFFRGVELANGFNELTNSEEQERRFDLELAERKQKGLTLPPKDEHFLSALKAGLPACSGVAVGLDRILMLMMDSETINDVLAFPFTRV